MERNKNRSENLFCLRWNSPPFRSPTAANRRLYLSTIYACVYVYICHIDTHSNYNRHLHIKHNSIYANRTRNS